MESNGLRTSRIKTEFLKCNFSGLEQESDQEVTIGQDVVAYTTKYKCLGSIIKSNREISEDVTHRIQACWLKWRAAYGLLCDRKFPTRLVEFYRVAIMSILLYGTEVDL